MATWEAHQKRRNLPARSRQPAPVPAPPGPTGRAPGLKALNLHADRDASPSAAPAHRAAHQRGLARQQPADLAAATWWTPPAQPCRVLPDLHATTDRAALLPSACRSGRGRHSAWTVNHWPLSTMPFFLIEQR